MIQIIEAKLNNLEQVLSLFHKYREFYQVDYKPLEAENFLRERITKEQSKIFLVLDDDRPVGFTQLYPSFSSLSLKPVWILNDLYVEEQYRKKGIGKMLLDAAKNFALQTKSKGLTLTTGIENTVAQSLYEKYGFIRNDHFYEYYLFF